ncbi:MAG: hypothetical protein IKB71_03615 [Lentisphaeria bacterium]|nr:hypothetical protein [Lentisphaeria bacterium]
MKKIVMSTLIALLVSTVCSAAVKKYPRQDRLVLPEKIYAVPDIECNIYFKNVFLAVNHANYVFDVDCKIGRNDLKRWRYIPTAKDGGKAFPLTLTVYNEENQIVAQGKTSICIANADAGKDQNINILLVGASIVNYTVFPNQLYQLCKTGNNPKLNMIGTRHFDPKGMKLPEIVKHEGHAGWTWNKFLTYWTGDGEKDAKSVFLSKKDGKLVFGLEDYLKKHNFKTPDVITFQTGINDIFHATDENREECINTVIKNMETTIAAFRKTAPNAVYGIGLSTPGANQDAFGNKYKCGQTAWGYSKNNFALNAAIIKHFQGKDSKIIIIPSMIGIDSENNFPVRKESVSHGTKNTIYRQDNGVHPSVSGYNQLGDIYYAWLKNMISEK